MTDSTVPNAAAPLAPHSIIGILGGGSPPEACAGRR